jgi:hypothetical protein
MTRVRIETRTDIDLDVKAAAKWFAGLSDDDMAEFLIEVAELAKAFPGSPDDQWYYLGGHLRNCPCATDAAREMVKAWAHWIDHSNHGAHDDRRSDPAE